MANGYVYIVQEHDNCEYQGIHGVFSTPEKADHYIANHEDSKYLYVDVLLIDIPKTE